MFLTKIPFLLGLFTLSFLSADSAYLVEDSANLEVLPKRFRILPPEDSQFHISGSAQFSEKNLQQLFQAIKTDLPLYIIDLREESHGFLDGMAISWYAPENKINEGQSLAAIEEGEQFLLQGLDEKKKAIVYTILEKNGLGFFNRLKPNEFSFKAAESEENLVTRSIRAKYLRLPTSDHNPPSPLVVRKFLVFIEEVQKESPRGAWLHFHCRGGAGRTTLFMAMVDILQRGCKYSLEEIARRQIDIGGIHLLQDLAPTNWKYKSNKARKEFLQNFYTSFAT